MSTVFTGTVYHTLKRTLREIVTDSSDGLEANCVMKKYCTEGTMDDNYVDDLEVGGPGLASEITEGAELTAGSLQEGVLTRYLSRKFGLKMIITEEAMEDCKYESALDLMKRLKRALWKTVDIDAANILARMFNSSYVGADGVCLGSSSHALPGGGTFSNIMATAMTPSRSALIIAKAALRKMPGHDGVVDGTIQMEKILCPVDQESVWQGIVGSEKAPEAGQFNQINVMNKSHGGTITEVVGNPYWTNTTTNWALTTNVENGLNFMWRRKPTYKEWVDNDQGLAKHGMTARWARGWSDPRGVFGSNS